MTATAPSIRPSVHGGARLRYDAAPGDTTRLSEQWVRPPLHLAKAYHDSGWAISQLTSPTAGLLSGDVLEIDAVVSEGAKAALISPAACRVHTMESGEARVRQHYVVEAGAALDVWPAPLVLQRDATLSQETRIDASAQGSLIFCETVTPGRIAHGECFEFAEWRSKLKLFREGELLAFENFTARPGVGDLADWRKSYPTGSYASLYVLSPEPMDALVEALHRLETPNATLGVSPLRGGGGVGVKVLAGNGASLRKTIFSARNLLLQALAVRFPPALRRAQTFYY